MRIRSARNLLFLREDGQLAASHVLTRSRFTCSHDLLLFLAMVDKWTDCEDLPDLLPATPKDELPATIQQPA